MPPIAHPFTLVDIASIGVDYFTYSVAFSIGPKAGVDASVWVVAYAESVSFVVGEAAVVVAAVWVGHCTAAVALVERVSLAVVGT